MREEIITSGRMNPGVDPYLHVWGWEIAIYLFVGGLAAGLLFFSAYYVLAGKTKELPSAVKWAPMFVPFLLIIGLSALFYDLHNKLYFWQLYTTIRLESPMSWGAWTLLVVTPFSMLWSAPFIREIFPNWNWWNIKILLGIEEWMTKNRRALAWPLLIFAVILGIYTGILLSAFNARPLWNTAILGPLFLTSGLSTAAALIMWLSKDAMERKLFSKIDLILIGIELFLITHMFMGYLAGPEVQIESVRLFLGGEFTTVFWVFVVFMGLIIPAGIEILELKGYHIPVSIPSILVLFGGLAFRFIILEAGQLTRYLY